MLVEIKEGGSDMRATYNFHHPKFRQPKHSIQDVIDRIEKAIMETDKPESKAKLREAIYYWEGERAKGRR